MSNLYDIPPHCGNEDETVGLMETDSKIYNDEGEGRSVSPHCLDRETAPLFSSQNTYTETTIRKREGEFERQKMYHSEEMINSMVADKKRVTYTKVIKPITSARRGTIQYNTDNILGSRTTDKGVGPDRPHSYERDDSCGGKRDVYFGGKREDDCDLNRDDDCGRKREESFDGKRDENCSSGMKDDTCTRRYSMRDYTCTRRYSIRDDTSGMKDDFYSGRNRENVPNNGGAGGRNVGVGGGGGGGKPEQQKVEPLTKYDTDTLIVPMDGVLLKETKIGTVAKVLSILAMVLIACTFPFSMIFCFKVIQQYERAVVLRLGRVCKGGSWGPGLCFYLPCLDEIKVVDMRTLSFEVPPQEVLTRDSVTVSVDAVVFFRISSPVASVCNVEDVEQSSRLLAQTTLRNIFGTKSLNELLAEREALSHDLQHTLDTATERWGVVVERVEIKDVRLPASLQRSMAAEAEAFREARAKEVAAQGEKDAAKALRDASDQLMLSPCSIQLRYLQTLTGISSGGGESSTIVFPVPLNILNRLGNLDITSPQPIYENVNPVVKK